MAWWKRISRRLVVQRKKARPGVEQLEDRAVPATISLASVGLPTTQGDGASSLTSSRGQSFSADGRYFVFYSEADNLTPGDTNTAGDIFREDLQTGTIALVSTDAAGDPATNGDNPSGSFDPSISADGRFVAFMSYASNLVANDANATPDIFVKDMDTGAVTLVSTDSSGNQLSGFSFYPAISADGNSVAFVEFTTNDAGGQTSDVYVKNLTSGTLTLASASATGVDGDGPSTHPAISADGTIVAFSSTADNLVPATTSGGGDIYEKNLTTGAITLVSANSSGVGGDGDSDNPTISADGTKIAFDSTSDDLVAGDQNQAGDVFVADLSANTITRVSTDGAGGEANGVSYDAHLTPDGSQVVFTSAATNLVDGDTNAQADVFLKNLSTGAIARVDTAADESQAVDGASAGTISPAADEVAFATDSGNLVAGDDNNLSDVFVKTLASGTVQLLSTGSSVNIGATGNSTLATSHTQISDDGRYVVYTSSAANLVAGSDANGPATDVYWYDTQTGQTVRVSSADDGTQGDASSSGPSISGDGTIIAFQSDADNLIPGDTNNATDVFIESPASQQIALLSQTQAGEIGNDASYDVSITRDFTYAVFVTKATNLFNDQQPNFSDVVVEDLLTGAITLVSADATGKQGAGDATDPSISDDGRYVTFLSDAPDLLPGDTSGQTDVYVKDMVTGTLTRVSVGTGGAAPDGASSNAQISGDGSTVVFVSAADNLVGGDTNGVADVFVADRATGAITLVSKAADGTLANSVSETPSISQDGRYVAFASYASNLVPGDSNGQEDVFEADLQSGTISLLSQAPDGTAADGASNLPAISGSGRTVAFTSQATNLVTGDVNQFGDVFVDQMDPAPNIVLNIPDSINEGDSLTLDASGTTSPNGDPLTFSWDLNGDGVYGDATGPVVTLTWAQLQSFGFDDGPGFRSVNLQVTDAFGSVVQSIQIPINDTPPTGVIAPDTFSAVIGGTASFTSTVTDPSATDTAAGINYSWAAAVDGTPITTDDPGTSPTFSFPIAANGSYDVTLTVSDKDGGSSTSDYTFTVGAASPPNVDLSAAPTTGTAGTPISFTGNVTDDAGTDGLAIAWSVTKDGADFADGTSTTVTFTPDAAASYVVTMTATDASNAVGTGTATIAVAAAQVQNPTLSLSGSAIFTPGSPYSLSFTNVVAGTNPITGYSINWGDGNTGTFTGSPTAQTHTYAAGQTAETITVSVTTSAGTFPVGTMPITATPVTGGPPVIDMSAAPDSAIPGDEIDFSVVATHTGTVTYTWNVTLNGSTFASGTGAEIDFTTTQAGNYVVNVSAADTIGTGTASSTIAVNNQVFPPVVDLSAAPTTGTSGTAIDFIATATSTSTSGVAPTFSWTVQKDGATFATGTGAEVNFTPDTDDTYNVTVNATDDTGTGSTTTTIVVGNPNTQINPSLTVVGATTFTPGIPYTLSFTNIDAGTNAIQSYAIDWGDGLVSSFNGAPTTKTHTFTGSATSESIRVTVMTSAGSFLVGTKSLLEVDTPPTTTLTGPTAVSLNVLYSLQIAPVTDAEGVTVTNWTIHWGDGTPDSTGAGLPPSSLTHTFTVAGDYTVSLDLTDASGPEPGVAVAGVTVAATTTGGPSFLSGDTTTLTGTGSFTRTVSFSDPSGGPFTGTVDYGDGNGPQTLSIDPNADTFALSDVYAANGTYTVTVTLADGNTSTIGTYTVVVAGLGGSVASPPAVTLGGNVTLTTGGSFTQTGAIADTGPGPLSATIDYGDGSGPQTLVLTGGSFTISHSYSSAGTYTVTVTATDNGLTGTSTISALVQNATTTQTPPIVSLGNSASATTGTPFTQSGSIADNGPGPLVATVDYGDGNGPQSLTLTGGAFTLNHTYTQAGTYVITVMAADGGFTGSASIGILVADAIVVTPPTVTLGGNVTATTGTAFTQSGSIADNGSGPLTATVDYGDGTGPQTLVVTNGSFTLSHTYALAGTYTVTVTATDNGLTGTATISAVVQAATVTPNDNFTDLVAQDSTGVWHVERSTGTSFVDMSFGSLFNPTQTWIDVLAADFTGDGRTDLAALNAATGQWYVAVDTGTSFTVTQWDTWSATVNWSHVSAVDLDHDGKFDIVGVNPITGSWQASFSQGASGATAIIGAWSPSVNYVDVQWADVDGDHRPDLVARVGDQVSTWYNQPVPGAVGSSAVLVAVTNPNGTLTPGSSSSGSGNSGSGNSGSGNSGSGGSDSGSGTTPVTPVTPTGPLFRRVTWMTSTPAKTTTQSTTTQSTTTASANVTSSSTTTTTSASTSSTSSTTTPVASSGLRRSLTWNFVPTTTTTPPPSGSSGGSTTQSFSQMLLGDVDGDGKADAVALSSTTNQWVVALSQGTKFGPATVWAGLSTTATWNTAKLVDLNGDGKMDLLVRSSADGSWWAAYSTGTGFNVVFLGTTDPGVTYSDIVTGDFNGDGLTDVAFRNASGQIIVGLSTGAGMTFSDWGSTDPTWTNLNAGLFV